MNNSDIEKGEDSEWRIALAKYIKVNSNPLGIEEALKEKVLGVAKVAMDSFLKSAKN